ncbi:MAG TPA: type 4a pilus biogenesis protein PilO [Phycisphaerae bacterium]|nr:type 4a pilus biogenesis protein PilO [Phycisphaerae bacterium]
MTPRRPTAWRFRKINFTVAAACVAAALPLCLAKVNPLLRPHSHLQQEHRRLEELRATAADLAAAVERQRTSLSQTRRDLAEERRRLQSAGNVNLRIARLADLAEKTGLTVDEIVPGDRSLLGLCWAVPVRLRASGNYPTCVLFLRKLKGAFPDTAVGAFDLSGKPEEPGKPIQFQVRLLWHTARDDLAAK